MLVLVGRFSSVVADRIRAGFGPQGEMNFMCVSDITQTGYI